MQFIFCPECGSKISSQAISCPYCGFQSENGKVPISLLPNETEPHFELSMPDNFQKQIVSYTIDDSHLVDFILDSNNLEMYFPNIYRVIRSLIPKETILVADITEKTKEMIRTGELVLAPDRNGQLLPILRKGKTGEFNTLIRLAERTIPTDLAVTLSSLSMQYQIGKVISAVQEVSKSVDEIRKELMDERLAKAESIYTQFQQAMYIQDTQLRTTKLLSLQSMASDSRISLQKNIERQLISLEEDSISFRKKDMAGEIAFAEMAALSNVAGVEYCSYYVLGEKEAGEIALRNYCSFLKRNDLTSENTLRAINSHTKRNHSVNYKAFLELSQQAEQLLNKQEKLKKLEKSK